MSEINIKITEIDNAIAKLQGLQSKCSLINTTPPITVGGGKTVNELEDIAEVYKALNIQFGELILNTILFFQNIKNSYVISDIRAAKGIRGGSFGGTGTTRNF